MGRVLFVSFPFLPFLFVCFSFASFAFCCVLLRVIRNRLAAHSPCAIDAIVSKRSRCPGDRQECAPRLSV